jgi:hypothetical protein
MPRQNSWDIFDKIFYPDAPRIEQSDKPKAKQGSKIMYVMFDEPFLIEKEKNHEAQDRK